MQNVAREMNLSATAFLRPADEGGAEEGGWHLRWFTPAVELELCGHATLASAHVLAETGRLSPEKSARFHTRSGLLEAWSRDGAIELDFPAHESAPVEPPEGLLEALDVAPRSVVQSRFGYVLIETASEEEVRAAAPDHARLRTLGVRGVILTAATAPSGQSPYDFVSRFFAPGAGIDEDPVTGSAHCALGPYWAARLGKTSLLAWQASARGGAVRVRVEGERVKLGGQAVTVVRGQLLA